MFCTEILNVYVICFLATAKTNAQTDNKNSYHYFSHVAPYLSLGLKHP